MLMLGPTMNQQAAERERRANITDAIDALLGGLKRTGASSKIMESIQRDVRSWLKIEVLKFGTKRVPLTAEPEILAEAVLKALQPLTPPTARRVTARDALDSWLTVDASRDVRRPPEFWLETEELKDPRAYLAGAVQTEAHRLFAMYGGRRELGAEDRDRREVDRRAASRLERVSEDKDASWRLGEYIRFDDDAEEHGETPAMGDPADMALRDLDRFTNDERERYYLALLARPGVTKAHTQREAGLSRSRAIALEARIHRGSS